MVFEGEVSQALPNWRHGEQGGVYKIQKRGYPSYTRVICIHICNLTIFIVIKSLSSDKDQPSLWASWIRIFYSHGLSELDLATIE